jgi:hypothetical protein
VVTLPSGQQPRGVLTRPRIDAGMMFAIPSPDRGMLFVHLPARYSGCSVPDSAGIHGWTEHKIVEISADTAMTHRRTAPLRNYTRCILELAGDGPEMALLGTIWPSDILKKR